MKALIKTAEQKGYSMRVIKAVEEVNSDQKQVLFNKIFKYFNGDIKGKIIAIWGLAFKPLTDDMREAPSLTLIKLLTDAGCQVKAYDPVAMNEAKRYLDDTITYSKDPYDTVFEADCLVLVTEWNEFRFPDWIRIKSIIKKPVVFDGRTIYNVNEMKSNGFEYFRIGINNST